MSVYHYNQILNLNNNVSIPANGPNNVVGGAGGTVTVPARSCVFNMSNVYVPSVTVNVVGGAVGATVIIPAQTVIIAGDTVTVPAQNALAIVGDPGATVNIPAYAAVNVRAPDNIYVNVNANCPFPVKRVKFNFAYVIGSINTIMSYIVTSDVTSSDVVGVLNNFQYIDANFVLWFIDGIKNINSFNYIFRDLRSINGFTLQFSNQNAVGNIVTASILLHIECFSE